MKQSSLILCVCLLSLGCGESPAPSEAVSSGEELRLPADLAIAEKSLEEPLTDDEVLAFMDLVQSLPGGKPPEFAPVPGSVGPKARTPEESVTASRQAVRDALTIDTLMQGWAPRSAVRRVLTERRVTPRELTSVMLRMSCALAADAMGGARNVAAQRVIADEKVESLVARIHQHERSHTQPPESLWNALDEAASLAEYLALLSSVSPESQQLVARHREELQAMLPATSNVSTTRESREDHRITPISFEEPVRNAKTRRR